MPVNLNETLAPKPKILIVDDEPQIRMAIGELLSDEFRPLLAENGSEAVRIALSEAPSLILLDIMMPGVDGIKVVEMLRESSITRGIPIIMLSAASHRENRIRSFDRGADDFVSKPFDTEELIARIRGKIRRMQEGSNSRSQGVLTCANLIVDSKAHVAYLDQLAIKLSALEFELLRLLIERQDEVVSREEILLKVWDKPAGSDRVIDAHIVALRKYLGDSGGVCRPFTGKVTC